MNKFQIISTLTFVFVLGLTGLPSSIIWADIFVHDIVAVKNQKVFLSARTRGKLFVKGGVLLKFYLDQKLLGQTLSGGDGFAYKPMIPDQAGFFQIRVSSAKESATGILLCLEKNSSIVVIDVEGSLFEGLIPKQPKRGSFRAIRRIAGQFPVIFLQTSFLGLRLVKLWLEKNEFTSNPLIPWRQGATFKTLSRRGFNIHTVIGSPAVIASAKSFKPLAFSFEPAETGETVRDWEQILQKMKIP